MNTNIEVKKMCGQSKIPIGARVKIIANKFGETEDNAMIGHTGTATHPFAFGETKAGWIGIYLDNNASMFGGQMNCHETEVATL